MAHLAFSQGADLLFLDKLVMQCVLLVATPSYIMLCAQCVLQY